MPALADGLIHGFVAPGFELVREEFINNFTKRGEVGAAVSVFIDNEVVVDLWGGYRNRRTRDVWEKDTLVQVFSSTKGFAALALALAHSKGYFSYAEKVSTYWPEFAQSGNENITVRQLLAHQAGLSPLHALPIHTFEDLDTARLAKFLAASPPAWEVGKRTWIPCVDDWGIDGGNSKKSRPAPPNPADIFSRRNSKTFASGIFT